MKKQIKPKKKILRSVAEFRTLIPVSNKTNKHSHQSIQNFLRDQTDIRRNKNRKRNEYYIVSEKEKQNLEVEERKGSSELTKGSRGWWSSGRRVGRTAKLLGSLRRRRFDVVHEWSLAAADGRRHFCSVVSLLSHFTLSLRLQKGQTFLALCFPF